MTPSRSPPPCAAVWFVCLAAAALLPPPACAYQDEGLIVFWAADGIHEIEMNASLAGGAAAPRTVLKQPRGDAAGVRWPPPVGGLAVDTNSKTVLWTSNAGKAGVFMAELDGSSKTASALVDAGAGPPADTFLGIDVDAAKAVAHYAVYEPAGPAIRLMSVAFEEDAAGGGWRAKGPPEAGVSVKVNSMQGGGGGVVLQGGTLYLTAAKAGAAGAADVPGVYKAKVSGSSTPKALASCAMYGAWKGSIGYAVVQTDDSLQFVDATESSASSRKSVLLKVPADHASMLEKPPFAVPVSVHTGVDAAGDARKVALQPSISATASVDDVLFLRGSPPTDIYEVDLKVPRSQAFRPIHKALSDELGEHGLGPIRWAKRVELDSLAPETEAPPGTPTDAPPTDEPAAADTPAPGAATATAVVEATETAVADAAATATAAVAADATKTAAADAAATATLVDDATPVPDADNATTAAPGGATPVPDAVCTAERLRPGCVEHEGCEFVTNHELALLSLPLAPPDPALPSSVLNGNCVVFGSMCDTLRSESECKVLTSCFWNPGTTTCLVSSYCSRRVTTALCAEDTYQCRWDEGVGVGCTVDLHVPAAGDESRQSLLMVALIAMGAICCLLICLAVLATRVKKYAGGGERKKWYQEARIESALQDAGYEPVVGEEGQITVYEIEDEEKERDRVRREEAKAQEYQQGLDRMLFDAADVMTLNKKDVCESASEEEDLSQDGSCDTDVVLGTTGTAARAVEHVGDRDGAGGGGGGGTDEFFLNLGGERTETEEKLVKQLEKARRDMARTQERHGREDRAAAGLTAVAAGGVDGSASVVDAGSFAGSKRGSRGVHTASFPSFGNNTLGFSLDAPPPASPSADAAGSPAASPADGNDGAAAGAGDAAPLPPTRQQGADGSVPPSPATSPHRRKLAGTTESRVAAWAQETNSAQAAAAAAAAAGGGPGASSTNPLRAASSEQAEAEGAAAGAGGAAGAKSPQKRNTLQDSVSSSSPSPSSKQSAKQGKRQSLQRPGSPESGVGGRSPSWAFNLSRHRSAKLCREIGPTLPHGVVEVSPNQSAIHGLTSSKHF